MGNVKMRLVFSVAGKPMWNAKDLDLAMQLLFKSMM